MEIIKLKLSELRSPEINVRKHTQLQIKEFARSLQKFGQVRPIVIDEKNVVYCGNCLVEAAKSIGWEIVDCYKIEGLSESDKKKLMIADNKIYTLGHDDYGAINDILGNLDDFDVPGFDTKTLETMFGDLEKDLDDFGILDKEEKDKIDRQKEIKQDNIEKSKRQESRQEENGQSYQYEQTNNTDGSENIVRSKDEEPVGDADMTTVHENNGRRKVVCPHCGGEVFVD